MKKKVLSLLLAAGLAVSMAACGGSSSTATEPAETAADQSTTAAAATEETASVAIDKEAFDSLVASGAVADDAEIEANAWAKSIKDAGVFRVGSTPTSFLFSQLDETDNGIRGFDAGLWQLLTRYILGDSGRCCICNLFHHGRASETHLLRRTVLYIPAGRNGQGRQQGHHGH